MTNHEQISKVIPDEPKVEQPINRQPPHRKHWVKVVDCGINLAMGTETPKHSGWKCCELCSTGYGHIKH